MAINLVTLRSTTEAQVNASLVIAWPDSLPSARSRMATAIADSAVACATATNTELAGIAAGASGPTGRIQLSDGTGAFTSDPGFTWDTGTDVLGVVGSINLNISGGTGDILAGTANVVSPTAGRRYIALKGSTGAGVLELITAQSDADGVIVGGVQMTDVNSASDKRVAGVFAYLSGSVANQRGGLLRFFTRADGGTVFTERVRISDLGYFGIGVNTTLDRPLVVSSAVGAALPAGDPTIMLQGSDNKERIGIRSIGVTAGATFVGWGGGGTVAVPTQTLIDTPLVQLNAGGVDNLGAYTGGNRARISMYAEEAFTTTSTPTYISFLTTPSGSTGVVERMRLTGSGYLGIGDTAPQAGPLATPSKLSISRPNGVWGLTIKAETAQQADMLLWKADNTVDHRILQFVLQTDTWMLRRVTDAGAAGQYFFYCATTNGAIGINTSAPNATARLHIVDTDTYYALVLDATVAGPTRAALRIVPQDTNPVTALAGDVYWRADALRERRASAWARVRDPVLAATMLPAGIAQTVDWNNGESQTIDLGSATGTVAVTMTNPVAGQSYVLKVIQDNTTARNLSWTTIVKWRGGTVPVITATLLAVDIITLYYDGTNWYGNIGQAYA